jgi:hypothetical protein
LNIKPFSCAILGPDGSGKSTSVLQLHDFFNENNNRARCVYGSKKEEQFFALTKKSYKVYNFLLSAPIPNSVNFLAQLYLIIIHYNIEFIDNFFKVRYFDPIKLNTIIIYDRYPYDRLLPLTRSYFSFKDKSFVYKCIVYILIAPFLKLNAYAYKLFFKKPNLVIILDVKPKELMKRRPQTYHSEYKSHISMKQYHEMESILQEMDVKVKISTNDMLIETIKDFI